MGRAGGGKLNISQMTSDENFIMTKKFFTIRTYHENLSGVILVKIKQIIFQN